MEIAESQMYLPSFLICPITFPDFFKKQSTTFPAVFADFLIVALYN
jgi:hypothetical protein